MTVTLALAPVSGSITHAVSAVNITVAGAAENTLTGYSTAVYPTSPEVRYYIKAVLAGQTDLKSYQFAVNSAGGHVFQDFIFPAAGTWTVTLNRVSDDGVAATSSPVVA
jgi:hypothetical protein